MQVTALTPQVRDKNRVNVFVDGVYTLSLELSQVVDLGVKVGRSYTEDELAALRTESQFGKTYAQALNYVLMRPHSAHEITQYLRRKTRDTRRPDGSVRAGISPETVARVLERLGEQAFSSKYVSGVASQEGE